jgi:hypothetical protein
VLFPPNIPWIVPYVPSMCTSSSGPYHGACMCVECISIDKQLWGCVGPWMLHNQCVGGVECSPQVWLRGGKGNAFNGMPPVAAAMVAVIHTVCCCCCDAAGYES